jgi:hypothetical protein
MRSPNLYNEIGDCAVKIICGSHRRGEHGGIAPTGKIIKIIARTFHLPFKTKIGRGDAPVLAPVTPIADHFLYGDGFAIWTKIAINFDQ